VFCDPEASPPETEMREMSPLIEDSWLRMPLTVVTSLLICWVVWFCRLLRLVEMPPALDRKVLTAVRASDRLRLDEGVAEAVVKAE
jgi:hypothetical protein